MQTVQSDAEAFAQACPDSFPALQKLGLGFPELMALRRCGYLMRDNRSRCGSEYWRLRFRCGRKTRTVYLGRDEQLIAAVQFELGVLQNERRLRKQLMRTVQHVRAALRASKERLGAVLLTCGFHYHGDAIRKLRRFSKAVSTS